MADVPPDILTAIKAAAKAEWPGDREMQDYYIESGTKGYLAVERTDFYDALPFKDQILEWAGQVSDEWEYRANFIADEIEAYGVLQKSPADVPTELFDDLKRKAAADHDYFSSQCEEVNQGVRHFRYVRDTRAKIGPIRDLLTRMESIIGEECYNNNIQNYSSWGVWEGEGRSFRYPLTVLRKGQEEKRRSRFEDLLPEELVTGHYKFGANELSINRALVKIIDVLESEYGFKMP